VGELAPSGQGAVHLVGLQIGGMQHRAGLPRSIPFGVVLHPDRPLQPRGALNFFHPAQPSGT